MYAERLRAQGKDVLLVFDEVFEYHYKECKIFEQIGQPCVLLSLRRLFFRRVRRMCFMS